MNKLILVLSIVSTVNCVPIKGPLRPGGPGIKFPPPPPPASPPPRQTNANSNSISSTKPNVTNLNLVDSLFNSQQPIMSSYCRSDQVTEWQFNNLVPTSYDKLQPPNKLNDGPVRVSISFKIAQLIAVNEAEQSFTLDILLSTKWHDKRLNYPPACNVSHSLDISWKDKLWVPEVYLVNGLSPSVIKITPLFFEIDALTSHIILVTRQVIKLRCHMDLFRFPQDAQNCNIDMAILSVKSERAYLTLESYSLSTARDFQNFYLIRHPNATSCIPLRGPSFSCVRARLTFFRNVSYYLIRHYGPSLLLVITAFVGFWIPPAGYPARVAIIVTPLLSLVTKQTQISHEINVSYVVALHIWMIFNIFFVFMCLIEYALAIVHCHIVSDKAVLGNTRSPSIFKTRVSHCISAALIRIYGHVDYEQNPLDRNKVDYIARLLFPFIYLLFLLVFFFIFLVPWLTSKYYHIHSS